MEKYICLEVRFADSNKSYYYLTEDPTIKKNDYVIVYVGIDTVVKVVDVGFFSEEELPISIDRMKYIKGLYKRKADIHYEQPNVYDPDLAYDAQEGNRSDLFDMLKGVSHQYHECLTEAEVREFEKRNNVRLPLEYRRFLKEIGNGIRFKEPNNTGINKDRIRYREIYGISLKEKRKHYQYVFPFDEKGYHENQPFYPDCRFNNTCDLEDMCKVCDHKYICPDGIEEYTGKARWHGSMEITYAGCSYYYHLILNGPFRGQVWASGDDWFVPHKRTFSEFLKWLLEAEAY